MHVPHACSPQRASNAEIVPAAFGALPWIVQSPATPTGTRGRWRRGCYRKQQPRRCGKANRSAGAVPHDEFTDTPGSQTSQASRAPLSRGTSARGAGPHQGRPAWRNKLLALHVSVYPCLAWCSGTRHWTWEELRSILTAQLRMTRRICGWWPQGTETYPEYAKRSARWAWALWAESGIPF